MNIFDLSGLDDIGDIERHFLAFVRGGIDARRTGAVPRSPQVSNRSKMLIEVLRSGSPEKLRRRTTPRCCCSRSLGVGSGSLLITT